MTLKVSAIIACCLLTACAATDDKATVYVEPEKAVEVERPLKEKAKTLTELGLAYYKLGRYEYAEDNLRKSLAIDAKNAMTYQVMALIYVRRHLPEKAQFYFDKAMLLSPTDFNILTDYAVFLLGQQRTEEALLAFNKIIKAPFFKNKWVAYYYLGNEDLQKQQPKLAEIKFYQALQLKADYTPCLLAMAKIRVSKQDFMSARGFIERYLTAAGHTLAGLQQAIKIEQALGDKKMVEKYELELIRRYPFSQYAETLKRHY